MTARVYSSGEWLRARARRAIAGKAPRLAVRRCIYIRPWSNDRWATCIAEWRFGKWKDPQWLCGATTFDDARAVAVNAWNIHRLPIMWATGKDRYLRPFCLDAPLPPLKDAKARVRKSRAGEGAA
jgi:hypothetical protein